MNPGHPFRSVALVTLTLLLGCSAPPPDTEDKQAGVEAIVGGKQDRDRDAAVVAISIDGEGLCTGSLVAPRAVLTARHCVSETTGTIGCPSRGPQVGADRDPRSLEILVGDTVGTARVVARGADLVVPDDDVLCDRDIAVILLDRDVVGVVPLALALDGGGSKGALIRAVGFGQRSSGSGAGVKVTRAHVPIVDASTSEFLVGKVTCSGDSGGPAFDEATGKIVGVVSRGSNPCDTADAHNIYTRVPGFAAWLRDALHSAGPPGGADPQCGHGKRCPNGSHCDAATLSCKPVAKPGS